MRRIVSILLITVIMFTSCILTYAENTFKISVSSASATQNETVKLDVSIDNNPGIASYTLLLNYDNTKLVPVSILGDSITSNIQQSGVDLSKLSFVTALWVQPRNSTANGILFSVEFKVISEEKTTTPVTLSYTGICNQQLEKLFPELISGEVTLNFEPEPTETVAPIVDKTALKLKLDEAKAINAEEYTEESYSALSVAIMSAMSVYQNADASVLEIENAILEVELAILKLVKNPMIPGPTETVKPTATPAPTETVKPTATPVPTETVKPTATPVPTETVKPTATPVPTETVKPTAIPVPTETVKPTATPVPTETVKPTATPSPTETVKPTPIIDKTALKTAIDDAKVINANEYTKESYSMLLAAISVAESVYGKADAVELEVENAKLGIEIAILKLVKRPIAPTETTTPRPTATSTPTVNKSELKKMLDKARAISADEYTEESYSALSAAIASAESVYADSNATETAVNNAISGIKVTISGLVKKSEVSEPTSPPTPTAKPSEAPSATAIPTDYPYSISNAKLSNDGILTADIEYIGNLENASAKLIIALYNSVDAITDYSIEDIQGSEKFQKSGITLPENGMIRLFIWDSMESIKPLSEVIQIKE